MVSSYYSLLMIILSTMSIFLRDRVINTACKMILPFYSLIIFSLALYFVITAHLWAAFFSLYFLPIFTWKALNFFYPLKEGRSYIAGKKYSPWLSSYRIQEIYIKLPFLEKIIMLIPFLYNFWLRAWGSRIGKRVLFAPNITIIDRAGLEIGDYVYVGDQCYFSSHIILEKNKKFICLYKKIHIGDGAFIGAFTKFAPGAQVKAHSRVKVFSFFRINSITAESSIS